MRKMSLLCHTASLFIFMGLVCISSVGCATTKTVGPGIDTYVKMRWPAGVDVAGDGTVYYVYNPEGIRQLFAVDGGAGRPVALTSFEDGIGGYSLSDDGQWLGITASTGGSEQADLFLMNTEQRRLEALFENPSVVYGSVLWRRDSKAFAYRANDESPSDFHVYLYDVANRTSRKVHSGKGYFYPVDFNSDGSKLVIGKYNSASYSQLFEVTLATGEIREITPHTQQWSFSGVGYSADDSRFFVNTDYQSDLKSIHAIDLAQGNVTPLLPELSGKHTDGAALNEDRTLLAVVVNEDGYGTLHLRHAADMKPWPGPPMTKGIVGNIRFQGDNMLYSLSNANTPGIVYRWNWRKAGSNTEALTSADTQGVDVSKFRLPELIQYQSFDGKEIPAFLYLPTTYRAGRKIPFLCYYHGGPEGQFRPGFNRTFQYFLTQGYGIIAPNVRGSSGYGKAYIEADNYKNRHKSVKDGIWAAKYVIDQGYTDEKMVAAWGGSYGGFMVMAVITESPEIFGAGCNVVGIVNFETFLQQTKSYRRKLREVEYGPLSDPEFLRSVSPIYKVDRIETPLMLAHGLNDPRVPVGEAMQVAVALKKRGVEVEELYFPDEGHGFAKEENRLLYYQQMAKFFDKHLR